MKAEEKLDQEVDRLWQQMRYAYEHGGGHAGHLNNAWHTAMRLSKELLRLHAENERLVAEVANRNRRALEGDEAVTALANVHKHYENEVRVLTETLQRCKEVGNFTAECYRLDLERDEALLRQALEALEEYQQKGAPWLSCDIVANAIRQHLEGKQ